MELPELPFRHPLEIHRRALEGIVFFLQIDETGWLPIFSATFTLLAVRSFVFVIQSVGPLRHGVNRL